MQCGTTPITPPPVILRIPDAWVCLLERVRLYVCCVSLCPLGACCPWVVVRVKPWDTPSGRRRRKLNQSGGGAQGAGDLTAAESDALDAAKHADERVAVRVCDGVVLPCWALVCV